MASLSAAQLGALQRIEALPSNLSPRNFFSRARDAASRNRLTSVEKAAERAFSAFKLLPDDYFGNKTVEEYSFHAIFPDYRNKNFPSAKEGDLEQILEIVKEARELTLYYHVEYCLMKCKYCSFHSVPIKSAGKRGAPTILQYFDMMQKEISIWDKLTGSLGKPISAVYFGGGTPSVLPPEMLKKLFAFMNGLNLVRGHEITCETSPGTLTREKIEIIKENASRISIGVQTFDDRLLKFIGRDHNSAQAERAVEELMKNSDNVNVDLMYALPSNNGILATWLETLEKITELSPPSITFYRYWLKTSSFWFDKKLNFPHEMLARLMYFMGAEMLENAGYSLGMLHWFLKGGRNETYKNRWGEGIPNVGFGPAGYGSSRDFAFLKTGDLQEYAQSISSGIIPLKGVLVFGSNLQQASKIFGELKAYHTTALPSGLSDRIQKTIGTWVEYGLAEKEQNVLKLTDAGKALFEWMAEELWDAVK